MSVNNLKTGEVICSCISSGTIFKTVKLTPGNYTIEVMNLTKSPEFDLSYNLIYYTGSKGGRAETSSVLLTSLIIGIVLLVAGMILWFMRFKGALENNHVKL